VFFDSETKFEASADRLAEAHETDLAWIRLHTEFGEQARRWASASKPNGLLLRSPVLEQAERWIATRPRGAPEPTEETQVFIRASRQGATRRRNILTGGLAAGLVVALALAGYAYVQRGIAVEQRGVAEEQQRIAERERNAAIEERDRALRNQSRLLANLAIQKTKEGDAAAGLRLALEALPDHAAGIDRPYVPEAQLALDTGWRAPRLIKMLEGHGYWVLDASFSPDSKRVVTASADKTAMLWDVQNGERQAVFTTPTR
jgi:hypothetical protein